MTSGGVELRPRSPSSQKDSIQDEPPTMEPSMPHDHEIRDDSSSSRRRRRRPSCSGCGGCCCPCCVPLWQYGGIPEARGYALLAMGRGVAVMSNVVVNAALLELASAAAGCPVGDELRAIEEECTCDYECTGTVYGQNPLSLISNIAVVTGLLSAFFMPIIGVLLDFTSYRRFVGVLFSAVFTAIQAIQIAIGEDTWFPMAILQSIAGFCFAGMIMTSLAYLPEICEKAGQEKHTIYTARFTAKQFLVQASFLVLIGGLSFVFGIADDSVTTARMSQAINFALISVLFGVGWHVYTPSRPASRDLPEGTHGLGIVAYGLRQNVRTAKSIFREFKKGLRWFLFAEIFAQSTVGALTTISVVYLSSEVGLTATDISMFFLVTLVGTLPGAAISKPISTRTNPNVSWQLSMICLFIVMVIGAFTLPNTPNKYLSFIWGFFVGAVLGWFYPTENLFFSCVLPKGQEAEISGFRVICSMILSWLPPLMFSILVSNGVAAKWGMSIMASFTFPLGSVVSCACSRILFWQASFILIAASMLKFGAHESWEEILLESGRGDDPAEQQNCAEQPGA
ncbi:hypothetical protein ACHAXT_010938 [Thalassiosira profunda]